MAEVNGGQGEFEGSGFEEHEGAAVHIAKTTERQSMKQIVTLGMAKKEE